MRILITSGGTKVPIDPVRNIANNSTGRFGAALAKEALIAGSEVVYLTSQEGRSAFSTQIDCLESHALEEDLSRIKQLYEFAKQYRSKYHEHRYHNYAEYAEKLKQLIQTFKPDIVILAAAVSDYLVSHYTNEKIRSSENLTITLQHAPKVINKIKEWSPNTFLVGFKLLIDASDAELVEAAQKTMNNSHANIVVANNLSSVMRGQHEILIVEKSGEFKKIKNDLATKLIQRVMQR